MPPHCDSRDGPVVNAAREAVVEIDAVAIIPEYGRTPRLGEEAQCSLSQLRPQALCWCTVLSSVRRRGPALAPALCYLQLSKAYQAAAEPIVRLGVVYWDIRCLSRLSVEATSPRGFGCEAARRRRGSG
jgi:hypothetical protein